MRSSLSFAVVLAISGTVQAADPTFPSSAGNLAVRTVAQGLSHPWSLAFLPDGRMLVTERPGRIRIVAPNGQLSPPLANVPRVFAVRQGELVDVILDRNFAQNHIVYCSCSAALDGGGRTALARARGEPGEVPRLADVKV